MSQAARSILVFGVYLTVVGLGLVLVPNALLASLRLPPSVEVWPRILGVVTLVLAYYYVTAARREVTEFFRWTVPARVFVFVVLAAFVLTGIAPFPVALLGTVDLAAAVWTGLTLRRAAS